MKKKKIGSLFNLHVERKKHCKGYSYHHFQGSTLPLDGSTARSNTIAYETMNYKPDLVGNTCSFADEVYISCKKTANVNGDYNDS